MPRGDGTGPLGEGPMTGRGRGYCVMELPENGKLPEIVSEVLSELNDESVFPDPFLDDTAQLRIRIGKMQSAIRDLDRRIALIKEKKRKRLAWLISIKRKERKRL